MKILNLILLLFCFFPTVFAQPEKEVRGQIDLKGRWQFELDPEGKSAENNFPAKSFSDAIMLPGTTDTNKKGHLNTKKDETTYLSRVYSYVGKAWYKREIEIPKDWKNKVVTLTLERTKPTQVWIDGQDAGRNDNVSTPQIYDLTRFLFPGKHEIVIMVDNGKSVPDEILANSHAYTESTQTNWNGIIGNLFLEAKEKLHIAEISLYPDAANKKVKVKVKLASPEKIGRNTRLAISATAWNTPVEHTVEAMKYKLTKSQSEYAFDYDLGDDALLWSEFHPALYKLNVELPGYDRQSVNFGLRDFKVKGTQFAMNDTILFLRGKHDACVFPLIAHTAMDLDTWRHYFRVAKSYGINHYRFHSWCPPEACFDAADMEGIYLQPELPFWGWLGKEKEALLSFLKKEGIHIQKEYGNHASFVMFALGNELSGDFEVMQSLLNTFRQVDDRHLYAYGSNNYLGFKGQMPGEDYLTTCRIGPEKPQGFETHTRGSFSFADAYDGGYINHTYPNTVMDFSPALTHCRVPVISHETGQFQVYPNYKEISKYTGVLYPYNMEVFRQRLAKAGMSEQADDFFRASGKWAVELYKADIEMDLRTPGFAGFQLLDLQDYPGQGSAYIGILDAFMDSKGLVSPKRWKGFCCETVPLLIIEKFCWTNEEDLTGKIKIANYSPNSLENKELVWVLNDSQGREIDAGSHTVLSGETGLLDIGEIHPRISSLAKAQRLNLEIAIAGTAYKNSYPLWIYPAKNEPEACPEITVTKELGPEIIDKLRNGDKVLWFPKREQYKELTVGGLFQTDYWNYRMFKNICDNAKKPASPGTLGILTHEEHPVFRDFPTDSHTNWQWFSIIKQSYPLILDRLPANYKPIVQVIDNVERNHKLGLIFEFSIGKGKLLICMSDLEAVQDKPEVRQLYNSMLHYMASDDFKPETHLSVDALNELLHTKATSEKVKELKNISYE